jgi:hypothetical protein
MTREQITSEYEVRNGRIISPGKFEGEPIFAPALWAIVLDGFSDGDDGRIARLNVPKGDALRSEWPELGAWLGRRHSVRLTEDDQGFVRCR